MGIKFPISFTLASQEVKFERLISRSEAKARGLKYYFTGKPCSRGHLRPRYTGSLTCIECSREDGRNSYSPEKNRKYKLRSKYGISTEQYDTLLKEQDNVCAICAEESHILVVDHNHDTGEIRGLLCHPCNRGLGHFRDDLSRLRLAVKYMEQQNGGN